MYKETDYSSKECVTLIKIIIFVELDKQNLVYSYLFFILGFLFNQHI